MLNLCNAPFNYFGYIKIRFVVTLFVTIEVSEIQICDFLMLQIKKINANLRLKNLNFFEFMYNGQ